MRTPMRAVLRLALTAWVGLAGLTIMASDVPGSQDLEVGRQVSLSLSGDDEAALTGYYEGLSAGGTVSMPLAKAPWGDTFGMFTDRFGIAWLVNITSPTA